MTDNENENRYRRAEQSLANYLAEDDDIKAAGN